MNFDGYLFDHGSFIKLEGGTVIATGMPYSTKELTSRDFERFKKEFDIPDDIKMAFLDDKYKYRKNGDFLVIFYSDKAFNARAHEISPA